jgi:uncharacterized membrane protein SpoIIM required for sporulation
LLIYASAQVAWDYASTNPNGITIAQDTYTQIEAQREVITWQSILLNNLYASFIPIVCLPIAGLFLFASVLSNTGEVIGYLAFSTGYSPFNYLLAISFPVGIIEISAYALISAEVLYLFFLFITKRKPAERLLRHSWKTLIIYLVLLFIGAVVEAFLIG